MKPNTGQIYQSVRKAAGYSQERWAELLNTSTKSIQNYEAGITLPADDIVFRMIDLTGATHLAYTHFRRVHELFSDYLPVVEEKGLAAAAISMMKELADIMKVEKDIIEIACDGKVSDDEREKANAIIKEARELIAALTMLVCSLS